MTEHLADDARARPRLVRPVTAGQVLQLIRTRPAITRSEVGALTALSRTAVTARVGALIELGLVIETDDGVAGLGRPPTRLVFNARAGVVLAAAVGRSRIQLAVCDLSGKPISEAALDQEIGHGPDDVLPGVADALADLLVGTGTATAAVRGIGISIPGTVNSLTRCSDSSPIMAGWHGVPLDRYFARFARAPLFVENDTNVIALSERDGHLTTGRDALIVKASTGFGAGIVTGGVLQRGALGAAGEIGHVKYAPARNIACRCGEVGCLEAVAGGWALVRTMHESGHAVAHVRDVVALAMDGNQEARRALRRSGRHFGAVLATAVTLLNPAVIVIGGDMVPAYDLFVAGLRETLYRDAGAIATRELTIVPTTHGAESGVRGCATLAIDHVLNPRAVDALLDARGHRS